MSGVVDPLVAQLTARGSIDPPTVDWGRAHAHAHGMSLETALLELDAIGEDEILQALAAHFGLEPISAAEIAAARPESLSRFTEGFSRSFQLCPLALAGDRLTVLVEQPLSRESLLEMRELFGVDVVQRVGTGHQRALAWARVYGHEVEARTAELERRLERRRNAPSVGSVLARVAAQTNLADALDAILGFASRFFDTACFLVARGGTLRVAASRGAELTREAMPLPERGCSLGMAVQHGGYFMGPVAATPADQIFYAALGHPRPAWAFVAPVPASTQGTLVLYADNGPRGIAKRWVAEVSLLVARLGQGGERRSARPPAVDAQTEDVELPIDDGTTARSDVEDAAAHASPTGIAAPPPSLDAEEHAALTKLRAAAEASGTTVRALVDELLELRQAHGARDPSAALATEVSGLFQKLAADIPAQLARGMENAFRDLVPRIAQAPAGVAPPAVASGAAAAVANATKAGDSAGGASPGIVIKQDAGPREVPSYRSRRRKVERVKL